jgi:hypothetical protein
MIWPMNHNPGKSQHHFLVTPAFRSLHPLHSPLSQALFDLQLSSIKALHPTQASVDGHPPRLHILAERYAHLTASMLLLHADFLDGPLDTNIDRLRYAGETAYYFTSLFYDLVLRCSDGWLYEMCWSGLMGVRMLWDVRLLGSEVI